MFPKKDIKIPDNNINGIIKKETEEFDTYPDHGLFKIKCEFNEEETKIQTGVLENQFAEKNVDGLQFSDGEFSKSAQKIESTINVIFSKKAIKIEDDEIKSENTEKYYEINTSPDSSNIKCEFEEEETKIQYGVFENQLHEENFDKSTTDIPKLRMLDGEFTKSFQETELPISNMFSKKDIESTRCQTCNKCFTTKINLDAHIKIHTGVKPYKCETCNKCFVTKTQLNRHNKTHTVQKPYKCEKCGKCFIEKGLLNTHNRTHTGEKPYKCETCDKCFASKTQLNFHNRSHTGEKPYICETCGKYFMQQEHLNAHNRTHTGEKPYKCETCGKCFATKTQLNLHIRTHTGEKPYKCETCSKSFALKATLNLHIRTHTGEKPYECKTCGKCFGYRNALHAHVKIHSR